MPSTLATRRCTNCQAEIEAGARFCGGCGQRLAGRHQGQAEADRLPQANLPGFVRVPPGASYSASANMADELESLTVVLWRERIFLLAFWAAFIAVNLTGFALSVECFTRFIGDTISKLIMAGTPFLFVNIPSLLCFLLINGAKRQIARLKEKINYTRFRMEHSYLL